MNILTYLVRHWRRIKNNAEKILVMNQRNLEYIYPNNERIDYPIADNKLYTKEMLLPHHVPMPETYNSYGYFYELAQLERDLFNRSAFVIKPASGSGGGGILVVKQKQDDGWIGADGQFYSIADLQRHISDIIFGIYSFGLRDEAIVEALIIQHPSIDHLSPHGLADVRIICYQSKLAMAMLRLATNESNGKANLHQGAIGVGVDIESGVTTYATAKGHIITQHPDSAEELLGHNLPDWQDTIKVAAQVAKAVPLNYLGIDIAMSESGPQVLEINVRPGIEIQNANQLGLKERLTNLENMHG